MFPIPVVLLKNKASVHFQTSICGCLPLFCLGIGMLLAGKTERCISLIPFLFPDHVNCLQSWVDVNAEAQRAEPSTYILVKESILFYYFS